MTQNCPTCGHPLPAPHGITLDRTVVTYAGQSVRVSLSESVLLARLLHDIGKTVTHDTLIGRLYAGRPSNLGNVKDIAVFIYNLRARIRPIGLTITSVWGAGYRLDHPNVADPVPGRCTPFAVLRKERDAADGLSERAAS